MRSAKTTVIFVTATVLVSAGEFKYGFDKSVTVPLTIPRPPDAFVQASSMSIQWQPTQSTFQRSLELTQLLQQSLGKEFNFTTSSPDAELKISIISYEPVVTENIIQTEQRNIKVGENTTYDKKGNPITTPVYAMRDAHVTYWVAHGSITASVLLVDRKGSPVDSFTPAVQINERREIAVNGVAATQTPLLFQKRPANTESTVQTPETLETTMLRRLATEAQRRYTSTADNVQVMLAVDSELRNGDKAAEAGQWKQALDSWTEAKPKKHPSDRLYNIAVAKEALAYSEYLQSQSLEELLPKFQEAVDLYKQALQGDPSEKYMQQAVARLEVAKRDMENARKQYQVQQASAKKAQELVEGKLAAVQEAGRVKALHDAAVHDTAPDSAEEARFRMIARTRVGAIAGPATDADVQDVIGLGQRAYGLTELKSYRVVFQEIDRKKNLGQALRDYEDTFKPMAADGKITSAERAELRDLQTALKLDEGDVKSVETKYHFVDATHVMAKASRTVTRPKTGKPPVGKPTTPATTVPAGIQPPEKPGIGAKSPTPNP